MTHGMDGGSHGTSDESAAGRATDECLAPGGRIEEAPTAGRTVLVVDDYPAVLAWAARAFVRAGWTVLTATDGAEALERWRVARANGRPVGVLVTDLELATWHGAHLAERLRAEDADLPVLALHTGERATVAWGVALLDRTAFFQKPVRAAVLVETATALMASRARVAASAGEELCPVEPEPLPVAAARAVAG